MKVLGTKAVLKPLSLASQTRGPHHPTWVVECNVKITSLKSKKNKKINNNNNNNNMKATGAENTNMWRDWLC